MDSKLNWEQVCKNSQFELKLLKQHRAAMEKNHMEWALPKSSLALVLRVKLYKFHLALPQ